MAKFSWELHDAITMMKDSSSLPPLEHPTRRRFLGTATSGLILASSSRLEALGQSIGETDHFNYRLAPDDGPFIDTQRDHRAFGYRGNKIYLSEDCAGNWIHEAEFPGAEAIEFSSLLSNGRVIFATQRRIFRANEDLSSIHELTVQDRHGEPYRPHFLQEGEVPGSYFYSLDGVHTFEVSGREMLIWGNYCNVRTGPTPQNIYYSIDGGETVKIAYAFGQNPAFQHQGAPSSEWVGDSQNPVVCRHIHSVSYDPVGNTFYACSGDKDREIGVGKECHWLRGTYEAATDTWDWKVIVSSDGNSRYKSGGINFVDGRAYWVSDANGPITLREVHDRGVFSCDPEDIPDKSKHQLVFPAKYEMAVMTIHGETMIIPRYGNADPADCGILFSTDLGKTWGDYDLKEFGDCSGVRVNPPNQDGWYRIQLMERWVTKGEVLFLKPKS